ncbi:TPA: helix-turn-helix transcriptional regulator [Enterococcus faecium]|uniref:helix-turn-helix domain-containing protein n=1 Tax=Enterococcus TaxID=1350 RepID=UPI00098C1EE8|nr:MULTISPECIES: helix-turn-helix transcriptional regulator [Enterococcus]EGP4945366.1 helix-turn-helix transcriptional regulator [Enterococcus faecium]EGP5127347.1 XRE family transcriptional regulator [Enterococcus faecium]EGP5363511.1 XRE family transcriptional regulator [Enterococcus faecium]EGP5741976.1 XRE family transcriptional regulator [Enterococcus faecium]EME3557247.1 helix-turn-helix transcriptional regulator [Enterococcus faecium]
MKFSYNPLWKLLIDRGIKKSELRDMTGISSASIAKLNKGENITTGILLRICEALKCDITDIMELVEK